MSVKQLTWRDNITEKGKEKGLIREIGEFYITKEHRNSFVTYHVSNFYAGGDILDKIMVFPSEEDYNEVASFDSIEKAKEFAQEHFENYIKTIFFNG